MRMQVMRRAIWALIFATVLFAAKAEAGQGDYYSCCGASGDQTCRYVDMMVACELDDECEGDYSVCCALACRIEGSPEIR